MSSQRSVLAVPFTEEDFRENGIIEKNVSYIFMGALAAKNQELTSLCIAFMKSHLNPVNCFQRLSFAIENKSEELVQAVSRYIRHCLATLPEEEGFLNISHDQLKALVDVDTDDGTDVLLTGILRWIKQDPRGRQQLLFGFVKNLKLASVDPASLKRLFGDDDFVRKNKDCRMLYLETIHSQYFTENDAGRENNGSTTGYSGVTGNHVVEAHPPQDSLDDSDEDVSITFAQVIDEETDRSTGSRTITKANPRKTLKRASKTTSDTDERSGSKEDKRLHKAPVRRSRKAKVGVVFPANSKSQIKDRMLSFLRANRRKNKTRTSCVTRNTSATSPSIASAALVDDQVPTRCESGATVGPYERNIAYFLQGAGKKRTLVCYNIETRGPATKVADFTSHDAEQVSLVYHSGHIYFLGGCLSSKLKTASDSVWAFHLVNSEWTKCPPMREKRYEFQPSVCNGRIYAIAGRNGKVMINCVETFDPVPSGVHPRLWSDADYPDKARSQCGVGTVGDKIYLIGGFFPGDLGSGDSDYSDTSMDDVYQELCVTRKVEAYDPLTDTWAEKSSLPVALLGISVAVHETNQCLYVFGGSRKTSSCKLKLAFVYYPGENRWTAIHEMCQARRYASSIVLRESIYVIGGNDGKPTMERYDIVSDTWEIVPDSNLPPDGLYESVAFADQAYGNFDSL